MIRFTILYPHTEGGRFDMEYYRYRHLPMVQSKLGSMCVRVSADEGIGTLNPQVPSPYAAMGHLDLDIQSPDEFLERYAPLGDAIRADVPNFTDIKPIGMLSRIWD